MYTLTAFGTVTLPAYNKSGDMGPPEVMNGTLELPFGAAFDAFGAANAPVKYPYTIQWACSAGGDSPDTDVQDVIDAVLACLGKRDALYRVNLVDNVTDYCYARLTKISMPSEPHEVLIQHFVLTFQVQTAWAVYSPE